MRTCNLAVTPSYPGLAARPLVNFRFGGACVGHFDSLPRPDSGYIDAVIRARVRSNQCLLGSLC
jgi:hypothetical protein